MSAYRRVLMPADEVLWRIKTAMGGAIPGSGRSLAHACWMLAISTQDQMQELVQRMGLKCRKKMRGLVEWYQAQWVNGAVTQEELAITSVVFGVPTMVMRVVPRGTWNRPALFVPRKHFSDGRCNVPGCAMPADRTLGVCRYHASMWLDARAYEQSRAAVGMEVML